MRTENNSSCTCSVCSVCARTHRLRKVVTNACCLGLLRGCGGPWKGGVSIMEKKRGGGGERTSQRDRASLLHIVSAYFMVSECPEEVGKMHT